METWAGLHLFERKVSGNLSLTFQDARNRSDETLLRRQRYYGRFLHTIRDGKGAPVWESGPWGSLPRTGGRTGRASVSLGHPTFPRKPLPARVIHTLSLRTEFRGSFSILAEAVNLTDDHNPDRWGYPKPGRGYYLTLTWNWERRE